MPCDAMLCHVMPCNAHAHAMHSASASAWGAMPTPCQECSRSPTVIHGVCTLSLLLLLLLLLLKTGLGAPWGGGGGGIRVYLWIGLHCLHVLM